MEQSEFPAHLVQEWQIAHLLPKCGAGECGYGKPGMGHLQQG